MTTTDALHAITVRGTTFGYTDTGGPGEPLLLVHAGVFSDWFVPLARELAPSPFRVIRMVRAGYGDAPSPTLPLSIADHAAHCAAALDALRAGPAHVVAHSSGSAIALQLAHDHPDAVRSLALSEPPLVDALVDPRDVEALGAAVGPTMGAVMASAAIGDTPAAYDAFMSAVCGPDHRAVVTEALGPAGLMRAEQESAFFFADEMGAVATWAPDPASPAGDAPVLLIRGGASPPFTHRMVEHLATVIPRARVATIDDDNHLLPLRSPAALAGLVIAFAHAPSADGAATTVSG